MKYKSFPNVFLVFALIILSLFLPFQKAHAESNEQNLLDIFPLAPSDAFWEDIETSEEMVVYSQVDETVLDSLTTRQLLQAILQNSFLLQFDYIEDSPYVFSYLRHDFNIFEELYSREDLLDAIVAEYEDSDLSPSATDPCLFFKVRNIELFIADAYFVFNGAPPSLQATSLLNTRLQNRYAQVQLERANNADVYSMASNGLAVYMRTMDSYERTNLLQSMGMNSPGVSTQATWVLLYSFPYYPPGGYEVTMKVYQEMTQAEIDQKDYQTAQTYPSVLKMYHASMKFNCHAYAWYSQDTTTNYWIDNPAGFYPCYTPNIIQVGSKVRYNSGQHSALLLEYDYNDVGGSTFISKWGLNGIYIHPAWYGPSVYQFSQGVVFYN